ncbi:MAG TPA: hypothetical protein VEI52_14275 [Terriglobales bacterium]|nr:hypothetical protein [Terriglobales bacterium]
MALTTEGGTIVVTLTITVKSVNIKTVNCTAEVVVSDAHSYAESATVAASGTTTRTCKITIPYSWELENPTADLVSVSYVISATGTGAGGGPLTRSSSSSIFPTFKLPPNGATTNESAAATI